MASYEQIMGILVGKTAPASPAEIAKDLGVKPNDVATPLKRLTEKKPPLVSVNEDGEYTITEDGRKNVNPVTEDGEGVTESQVFKSYGIRIGVPKDIVDLTQEHIWDGGDWKDLNWIKKGLNDMRIKDDLLQRWHSRWGSYLQKRISPEDKNALAAIGVTLEALPKVKDSKDAKSGTTRLRDYIIDAGNNVMYVGEENGDLEYPDAVRITTIRAASAARIPVTIADGGSGAKSSQITDAIALVEALQKMNGGSGSKKTMLLLPGENGYTLQEVESGSTVAIPRSGGGGAPPVPKGYYFGDDNEMHEIDPAKPTIIIKKEPAAPSPGAPPIPGKTYVVQQDGTMIENESGRPIIIHAQWSAPSGGMFSIPTSDGKSASLSLDDLTKWLDTTFKIEDHKARVARDQESHDVKMDFMKTVKEFASKGVKALGNMSSETEEE